MKNILIIRLSIAAIIPVIIVVLLYGLYEKRLNRQNGFNREFFKENLVKQRVIDLRSPDYYFAGAGTSTLYLGNGSAKGILLQVDLTNMRCVTKYLARATELPVDWQHSLLATDSPRFYLLEGVGKTLTSGNIADSLRPTAHQQLAEGFYHAAPLSSSSLMAIYYDNHFRQRNISRFGPQGNMLTHDVPLLEKQYDGRFCTDGQLFVNRPLNKTVYVYFYRNQFIVGDTNLHIHYKASTIDTNTTAKIRLGTTQKGRFTTLAVPPEIVNKKLYGDTTHLYIASNIRADNESPEQFFNNTVIDCYRLKDGKYTGSFYIPQSDKRSVQDFVIVNTTVCAIQGNSLVLYRLH